VNGLRGLELARPRDLSALLSDAFKVYRQHVRSFLLISAAFVVPVELIVSGVGLEQLTSAYDDSPSAAETVIPAVVTFLVVAPLITATCIYALREVAAAERPRPGRVIVAGLEAFTPLFFAIVLAALGILCGFVLIIPGFYLVVRWYFVPQAVVIDGARGAGALKASGDLVQGFWWRTLAVIAVANLVAALPGLVLIAPFSALAMSTDRAIWELVGQMAAESLAAPFVALVATLLYYDLRSRRS
jgi:hypothetical protein